MFWAREIPMKWQEEKVDYFELKSDLKGRLVWRIIVDKNFVCEERRIRSS